MESYPGICTGWSSPLRWEDSSFSPKVQLCGSGATRKAPDPMGPKGLTHPQAKAAFSDVLHTGLIIFTGTDPVAQPTMADKHNHLPGPSC